jgi:hypothetical protein
MGEFSRTPAQCFHDSLSEMLSRSSGNAEALDLDPLSEVLRDFRPSGVSYGHCRLTKPWGVDFPEDLLLGCTFWSLASVGFGRKSMSR